MFKDRLEQYKNRKGYKNKQLAEILGFTEEKVSKLLSGKYQGSFDEYEHIITTLKDDKYFLALGEQPPSAESNTKKLEQEMLPQIMMSVKDSMETLSREMRELREDLKEVKLKDKGENTSQSEPDPVKHASGMP